MIFRLSHLFISLFSLFLFSAAAAQENKVSALINKTNFSHSCQEKVQLLSDEVIGPKRHRVLPQNIADSESFYAFVLLSYNDQDSHVSFHVNDGDCEVTINESFELPASCVEARQNLFKRWSMLGRLSDTSIVMRYDSPRDKKELPIDPDARATAVLTQAQIGESCLIRKTRLNATPTKIINTTDHSED